MKSLPRILFAFACLSLCVVSTGCSTAWHNLQPHRLHQLNRGPGMDTGPDAYSCAEPHSNMTARTS